MLSMNSDGLRGLSDTPSFLSLFSQSSDEATIATVTDIPIRTAPKEFENVRDMKYAIRNRPATANAFLKPLTSGTGSLATIMPVREGLFSVSPNFLLVLFTMIFEAMLMARTMIISIRARKKRAE